MTLQELTDLTWLNWMVAGLVGHLAVWLLIRITERWKAERAAAWAEEDARLEASWRKVMG